MSVFMTRKGGEAVVNAGWSFERSGLVALLALTGVACVTTPAPAPHPNIAPATLSKDCLEWAEAQEALADLAVKTLQTYGRIDPAFYRRNEDGSLSRDPEARALATAAPEGFDVALRAINEKAPMRDALARGVAAAQAVCANDGCPVTAYGTTVTPIDTGTPELRWFTWNITSGDAPTVVQWRAFKLTYASAPPLCPVPPALTVRSRLSGMAFTSGLFNQGEPDAVRSGNPCGCRYPAGQLKTSPCQTCPYGFAPQLMGPCEEL